MDSDNMMRTFGKVRAHVLAEAAKHSHRARVVVLKRESPDSASKYGRIVVVFLFGTQVVDHVLARMAILQEVYRLVRWVTVAHFHPDGRDPHRNDSVRDVSEVEVIAIVLEASFFERYTAAEAKEDALTAAAEDGPRVATTWSRLDGCHAERCK